MTPDKVEMELDKAIALATKAHEQMEAKKDTWAYREESMSQRSARRSQFIGDYLNAYATLRGTRHDA